jgi:uncharacterized protein YbaP (TraB family)
MCYRWIAYFGLFFSSVTAQAQSTVWAIHGPHNTVYLAGSVHLLRPDDATLPPAFEKAYDDAEALVMELDLDDLDPTVAQNWMMEHGTLPGDATLKSTIGEVRYKRVAAEATRLGLPLRNMQKFEPWTIALTLVELQYSKLGFDPQEGVERQLERRARADRKEIRGLETLPEQLGKIDGLTYAQQARFLDLTVQDMHEMEDDTDDLLAAWRTGDNEKLTQLLGVEYKGFPELYHALVTERNQNWLPKIEALLTDPDKDYMVVVGALHLVGKNGLIQLLSQRGIKPTVLNN